jgi:hypothetical protein
MKRTTNLVTFAQAVTSQVLAFQKEDGATYRVCRISSPEAEGDVEIVLENPRAHVSRLAFTYRADGSFSGLSFWQEGQI